MTVLTSPRKQLGVRTALVLPAGLILVILISADVPCVRADRLFMKNGRVVDGVVKSETASSVVMGVGVGTVTILRSQIARIERSRLTRCSCCNEPSAVTRA